MSSKIIVGGGCFWCTEATFQRTPGVLKVVSGYCGGQEDHPTYELICSKTSAHAEVVEVEYDPEVLSLQTLLEIFWKTHDPTTPNQQGADQGPQYRSIIFPNDAREQELCQELIQKLQPQFSAPIVTEIVPHTEEHPFWTAEEEHQNFYNLHPQQGYCHFVITPKIDKLPKILTELMDL